MLSFHTIVVPTDFSDLSLAALGYAASFAERYNAKLEVIYVNEPALRVTDLAWVGIDERATEKEITDQSRRTLEKHLAAHLPPDTKVEATVVTGDAVDEITRLATDKNADLIVMATHGRSGLSHVLMGSTAEQVVRSAPCPVLTLRQPKQGKSEATG